MAAAGPPGGWLPDESWKQAVELGRLLEREDPETCRPDEVRHYIRIYGELIDFKRYLVALIISRIPRLSDEARNELSATDLPALETQLQRLKGRLQFWCRRLMDLEGIDLDRERLVVRHAGQTIALTRREFDLLSYLLRHPDQVLTAHQLVQVAWGQGYLGDDQLRTYITRLRRKMKRLNLPCRIVNRPRKGYFLLFD